MNSITNIDKLAFEFFREFSRCEYCLKVVGLRVHNRHNVKADWITFSTEVRLALEQPASVDLDNAIKYYLLHPPKKQIVRTDGTLDWSIDMPSHQHQAELILVLICRVRNNLFHGGKFNGQWFEPQRSEHLLTYALIILRACIAAHPRVQEAYEGGSF